MGLGCPLVVFGVTSRRHFHAAEPWRHVACWHAQGSDVSSSAIICPRKLAPSELSNGDAPGATCESPHRGLWEGGRGDRYAGTNGCCPRGMIAHLLILAADLSPRSPPTDVSLLAAWIPHIPIARVRDDTATTCACQGHRSVSRAFFPPHDIVYCFILPVILLFVQRACAHRVSTRGTLRLNDLKDIGDERRRHLPCGQTHQLSTPCGFVQELLRGSTNRSLRERDRQR